jgi:hypothetical protein
MIRITSRTTTHALGCLASMFKSGCYGLLDGAPLRTAAMTSRPDAVLGSSKVGGTPLPAPAPPPGYVVRTTMAQDGNFIRSVFTVRHPSPGGRCKSIIVTSGAQTAKLRSTAAASIASQTISMSVCLLNDIRKPSSIIGWSATIMTLILPGTQALSGRNCCSHYQARRVILDARTSESASHQAKTEFTLSSEDAVPREDIE